MEAVIPIPKIRSGNEFTFVWAIERDGVAEDLTDINITDLQLTVCVGGLCAERVDVPFTIVDTNKVRSQHLHERTGLYNLELTYKKAGVENEIDIDAFRIVARSAEASDSSEFTVSSDMAIAFKGDTGNGIQSITLTATVGKVKTYTITFTDLTTTTFTVTDGADGHSPVITFVGTTIYVDGVAGADLKGEKGDTGNGIQSITLLSTVGLVKTYRITYTDNTTYDYTVTDGASTPIVQITGTSTTDVMSQKAVTDELAKKHQVVVDYTHTGNKEVNIESIDFATGTITATGHGLGNRDPIFMVNKGSGIFPFSALPNGITPLTRYNAINVTPNTFQLSLTPSGAPITISDKATKDYSKWHFETQGNVTISGLSLRKFIVEFEGKSSGSTAVNDYLYLYGGKDYGTTGLVWITDTEYSKIASGLNRSIFRSMVNGDIWSYNRLEVDVTGKLASILINGYRIYSLTETTRGIIRHDNEVAVHSSVGEDVVTSFNQQGIFNGMNIKVTKIL